MPGSVTVEIASVVLSFPAYCALHPLLGADLGAAAAAILMCIGFPAAMIRLWKVYPPIPAVPVGPDDPVMSVCRERAMREFDRSKPGLAEGRKNAFVKYAVPTKGDGTERVRGHALALDGWDAIGSLVNEPVEGLADDASNDFRVRVPLSALEDWMPVDGNGRCEGGHSHPGMVKVYERLHGKFPGRCLRDPESFVDMHPSEYLQMNSKQTQRRVAVQY
jgi:hypothetical protein